MLTRSCVRSSVLGPTTYFIICCIDSIGKVWIIHTRLTWPLSIFRISSKLTASRMKKENHTIYNIQLKFRQKFRLIWVARLQSNTIPSPLQIHWFDLIFHLFSTDIEIADSFNNDQQQNQLQMICDYGKSVPVNLIPNPSGNQFKINRWTAIRNGFELHSKRQWSNMWFQFQKQLFLAHSNQWKL